MLGTSWRRVLSLLATTAVATATTLVVAAGPAHSTVSGALLVKGGGSLYSDTGLLHLGVVPGGSPRTYYYKVVNTGPVTEQYKIVLSTSNPGVKAAMYRGVTPVPSTYYTPPIEPSASLVLTVKVALASGAAPGAYPTTVELRDPDSDTVLRKAFGYAQATYQTGSLRNDLFLKTGNQPFVGGSLSGQSETGNMLAIGDTATFLLRVRNDGTTPAATTVSGFSGCGPSMVVTVKQGTKDVTTAVLNGTYSTGTLAPGAKRELTVRIKLVGGSCLAASIPFSATGPDGQIVQYAHVARAVD